AGNHSERRGQYASGCLGLFQRESFRKREPTGIKQILRPIRTESRKLLDDSRLKNPIALQIRSAAIVNNRFVRKISALCYKRSRKRRGVFTQAEMTFSCCSHEPREKRRVRRVKSCRKRALKDAIFFHRG